MDCHSGRGDATKTSADASTEASERGDASERGEATSATDSSLAHVELSPAELSRGPAAKVSSIDGTPEPDEDGTPESDEDGTPPEEVEGVSESFGPAARLLDRRRAAI